ncbi:MAG: BatA domain-containing protein [Myxococcota bacterium]
MEWALRHPELLPVLAVAALPLVVHLISRRKAREVRFAAMEFVLRSQQRSARRIQLRQWLLLLIRTLALLALAGAILGPMLAEPQQQAAGAKAAVKHVFAIDVTASMMAAPNDEPRWELAVKKARAALKDLPAEEPVAVVVCGASPQSLVEPPTFDRAVADGALDQVKGTLESGDLPACLARAKLALGSALEGPARITLFTDGARHAWTSRAAVDLRGVDIRVVRPDKESPVNRAIRSITVAAAPEAGARSVSVEVELEAWGHADGEEVEITLAVDGAPASRSSVVLKGAGPWQKRFTHALTGTAPVHDLSVALSADALTHDDTLWLPVKAPREVNVLVVDGDPQTVAWRDEVFYLERALRAPPKSGGRLSLKVLAQAPTPQEIEAADVVMLCNVRSLPAPAVGALRAHVKRGGGLFISGGDHVDVDFYNGSLMDLLPQALRGEKSRVELDDPARKEVLGLGHVEVDHPILAPFNGQRPEGLTRARTDTLLLLETGSRTEREVLMRFSNEAPALLERRVGMGRVLLWTTTVDRDWSDLAIRPGFLPLMQQAVLYLADALEDSRPRHTSHGEVRQVQVRKGVARVVVRSPSGAEQEVPVREEDARVAVRGLKELGIHQVLMNPPEGELTEVPGERFAVWPDTAESDLVPLSEEELAARMPQGARYLKDGGASGPLQQPMWPYLLAMLSLLFLAEGVLARRG